MMVVYFFVGMTSLLEKFILGLTYEVRGIEHLPRQGSFLLAAKHQSAYETFKLHILFNDPAIVLKQELLKIPFWGQYLAKSDVIAIDRSSPKKAIKSLQDGAQRVAKQGRPIIIFPQGTRVKPETTTKEKPYKIGIIRMQESTGLPIIPMALNTGLFYPKHSWCKKPGRVIFEFLPPIDIKEKAGDTLKELETIIESRSNALLEEGFKSIPSSGNALRRLGIFAAILTALYCAYWFTSAYFVQKGVNNFIEEFKKNPQITSAVLTSPAASGFPFKLNLDFPQQLIGLEEGSFTFKSIHAEGWMLPAMPIEITTGEVEILNDRWASGMVFDSLSSIFIIKGDILSIEHITLAKDVLRIEIAGDVKIQKDQEIPIFDLTLKIIGYDDFVSSLEQKRIIRDKQANMARTILNMLKQDGVVETKIFSRESGLFIGGFKVKTWDKDDFSPTHPKIEYKRRERPLKP
ncbi:MAG: 1-acyl-sn-glycerol-3-phosphate acyltransferase [Alphaproteobacteria bacterium]|nr:1-acyl-sn-glycerol-3-phosphate acyltransferase [Alphaproteobacteria bacterium]